MIIFIFDNSTQNFCTGLNRKYGEFCGLSDNDSTFALWPKSSCRACRTNVCGCVPTMLYVQTASAGQTWPVHGDFQHLRFAAW